MLKELSVLEGKVAEVTSLCRALRNENARLRQQIADVQRDADGVARQLESDDGVTARRTVLDVPLDALHRAAKAADGRLNDSFMAGITAGLHRYHQYHGQDIHELRVAMPVSLREEEHGEGGNHITVMRFSLPVAAASAKERITAMRSVVEGIRHERSLEHTATIAGFLNLMPKGVIGAMLKGVDFLASNVPGVPVPMWLEGSHVVRFFPFGPTAGSAVNVTLMSYNGHCCIGVNSDAAAIPDPDVLAECLRAGFDEACRSGEPPATVRKSRAKNAP